MNAYYFGFGICDFITDLINSEKIAERNSNQEFAEAWSISGSLVFLLNTVYKPLGRRELTSTQIEEAGRVAAFLNWDSSSVPQITENDLSDYFVASPQVATAGPIHDIQWGRFSSSGLREARKVRNQWVFKTKPNHTTPQITKVSDTYIQISTNFKTMCNHT